MSPSWELSNWRIALGPYELGVATIYKDYALYFAVSLNSMQYYNIYMCVYICVYRSVGRKF